MSLGSHTFGNGLTMRPHLITDEGVVTFNKDALNETFVCWKGDGRNKGLKGPLTARDQKVVNLNKEARRETSLFGKG